MVKVGDKPEFGFLLRNDYLKVLETNSFRFQYQFYQKRIGDRLIELILKNGVVDSKYIYEVLGNKMIKTLKAYHFKGD